MLPLELQRPFEEGFRRNREELGLAGGAVRIEGRKALCGAIVTESFVLLTQHASPSPQRAGREQGHAVPYAVLPIQLVRELVEHDVLAVRRIARPPHHLVPGHYDHAQAPRLPDGMAGRINSPVREAPAARFGTKAWG